MTGDWESLPQCSVARRASSMKRPGFCLSTVCAVFIVWTLFSVPWGSSCPLEGGTDSPQLRFVEEFDRFKLGFSWHNMSCAVCKAIFTTLDIALLVRQAFTSSCYCLLNSPGFPVDINVLFSGVRSKHWYSFLCSAWWSLCIEMLC